MSATFSSGLDWLPIDDGARTGTSVLLRRGRDMALGRWDGARFVYPATGGRAVDFEPTGCYDPAQHRQGAFSGR